MIAERMAVLLDAPVKEQGGVYTCPDRTAQQIAAALTQAEADEAAAVAAESTANTNAGSLTGEADQALAGLRQIANTGPNFVFDGLQLSRAARLFARCLIVLIRLQIRRLDGTD